MELTVEELSSRCEVPVRTIREYQTVGLLPGPQRRGRLGVYGPTHIARLELIARLQARGYSLAGIRDLVGSWSEGGDLAGVLGLEPDQLVHLDEPGAPATVDQLTALLPRLVPDRLDALVDVGLVEVCAPGRYCVPSPSLLRLTVEILGAGFSADDVLVLLGTVRTSTDAIATAVVALLAEPPAATPAKRIDALAQRGRGLLAHGVGRQTVYAVARRLGATDASSVATTARAAKRQARRS